MAYAYVVLGKKELRFRLLIRHGNPYGAMRRYAIYSFMVLGILGCKDKPYVERVEAIKKHELSGAILNPDDQSVLSSNSFRDGVSIKATVASTVPLIDCRWLIESEHQKDGEVVSGQGVIEGVN